MSRITNKDVRGAFQRAMTAATAAGLDVSRWRFEDGSPVNGINYTLSLSPYGSLGFGFGGDVLGQTASEAYAALMFMARAWELSVEIPRTIAGKTGQEA